MRSGVSESRDNEIELEMVGNRAAATSIGHNSSVLHEEATCAFDSVGNTISNETRTPPFDPLKILMPMTYACLVLFTALIFFALGMVALFGVVAIINKYVPDQYGWQDE